MNFKYLIDLYGVFLSLVNFVWDHCLYSYIIIYHLVNRTFKFHSMCMQIERYSLNLQSHDVII